MGSKSQRKGRGGEIELVKILQAHGYDVRPGAPLNYGQEPDIVGLRNIHCEVKRCEQLRLSEWLTQASRDSQKFGGLPAVFHRRNREEWMVTMPLGSWLELYERSGLA